MNEQMNNTIVFPGTEAPASTFRSTGTMVGVGSAYSSNPSLNADGTAAYYSPATTTTGRPVVRKNGTGTPGFPEDENQQPLGDAPWLLMIALLIGYGLVVKLRRR